MDACVLAALEIRERYEQLDQMKFIFLIQPKFYKGDIKDK